jgi:hypothetical protein
MTRNRLGLVAGACLALALTAPAYAALGGVSSTVETDRVKFRAARSARYVADYTVSTLALATGATVREYVNASDTVFAVSWRGSSRPDLQQLLGPSFDVLQKDVAQTAMTRRRVPLRVNRPGLVVQSGGHPGAFWGRAWLPQSLPAGVSAGELQ